MNCKTRGLRHVERIAAACVVHVVTRILFAAGDSSWRYRFRGTIRSAPIDYLRRMVVDNVQDYFDPGIVQCRTIILKLAYNFMRVFRSSVARGRV